MENQANDQEVIITGSSKQELVAKFEKLLDSHTDSISGGMAGPDLELGLKGGTSGVEGSVKVTWHF